MMDDINRVKTFDGNIQINSYDVEGLHAEMEENGRISKFVFDGKNVVAEETDGDVNGISEGTGFWRRTVNMRGRITIMWGMNWGALYM